MSTWLIDNVQAIRPRNGVVGQSILVENDRIRAIDPEPSAVSEDVEKIDGGGRLLTPGLIDLHVHAIGQYSFEADASQMHQGLEFLPRFGVTSVLPTLYRVMDHASLDKLGQLAQAARSTSKVRVPGLHLEGPFLALPGAGAATVPGDPALLSALLNATNDGVAAMSISPDTPNILPVIEQLVERNIAVFMTHTHANVAQTQTAIEAGARHGTHFYDVFPFPAETEPGVRPCGIVEAILADERVSVDFIADGVHVDPIAIRAALAAKGVERTLLITDGNIGAGLAEGVYDTPWGFPVRVKPGDGARLHMPGNPRDGGLAGSALTMDVGISNLLQWLPLAEHDVWSMATRSVAERMGWADLGDLRTDAMADLVLWDREADGRLRAVKTWVGGQLVFDANQADAET